MKTRSYAAFITLLVPFFQATSAVFTSDTLIVPTDFSYENQDIVISNCVVTMDGRHTFASLRVAGGGMLTHLDALTSTTNAGLFLTVSNDVEIEPGAIIRATGLGYAGNSGPGSGGTAGSPSSGGGGAYGGYGGISSSNAPGGTPYDVTWGPFQLGSGGGNGTGGVGGAGGGLVQLDIVGHQLILNGAITANGANATNSRSGGGSGGAIWITASSFAGNGSISADGGAGEPIHGGGGGGGRISIMTTYPTNNFSGTLSAKGGAGWQRGGAGTVFQSVTFPTNASAASLVLDNGGNAGAATLINYSGSDVTVQGRAIGLLQSSQTFQNLIVRSNSSLVPGVNNSGVLSFSVLSNAVIEAGATVALDGQGYVQNAGPGIGQFNGTVGGGAAHGGYGGSGQAGSSTAPGGNVYDVAISPNQVGSGGRSVTSYTGGVGGGATHITVSGNLQLNGRLSADATSGTGGSGGGSGGSVNLTLGGLSGSGTISANGGSGGLAGGGGGAGGMIYILYSSNSFTGALVAHGGNGGVPGGAGTILTQTRGSNGRLTMDNGGFRGTNTPVISTTLDDLFVLGGASATSSVSSTTLRTLMVGSNSTWFLNGGSSTVTVTSNATVQTSSVISGDGGSSATVGQGSGSSSGSGGGGNGGAGGRGLAATGGFLIGSAVVPTSLGSRGGSVGTAFFNGGDALHITINGSLSLDGRISANGQSANTNNCGGGAGGSIWITVGGLSGGGSLNADGGSGHLPLGGGGSGGRLAVYWTSNSFSGTYSAKGGAGYGNGGAGTIYLKPPNGFPNSLPTFIVDNGGLAGTNTVYPTTDGLSTFQDLRILGGAWLSNSSGSLTASNLIISSNSIFTPAASTFTVTVSNANIGGLLSLDSGAANGIANSSSSGSAGGSHGGLGGAGAGASGGTISIGTISQPTSIGTRGGNSAGTLANSGGALRMTVTGPLTLDGRITSNGGNGFSNSFSGGSGGGGSSGGAIWLTVNSIAGAGNIAVDGGAGILPANGGGGGGRIALYYNSNSFTGTFSSKGGIGYVSGGAGSIYLKRNNISQATLVFDNGTNAGTAFWDSSGGTLGDVTITGGATVIASSSISINNLTLGSNSTLAYSGSLFLSGAASIATGAALSADGANISSAAPGSPNGSGGGGHAGGGGSGFGAPGGFTTGSATSPTSLGSRGGSVNGQGGLGGGAIHLTANGLLQLNGRISANGLGVSSNGNGGGAGGSVWLSVGGISGSGLISADGGSGNLPSGGGGGGGRIAVYVNSNSFTGSFSAKGGAGFIRGGAGTIYTKTNNNSIATILVDNGGTKGTNTDVNPSGSFDLIAQGGAIISSVGSPRDLILHSNGWAGQSISGSSIFNVSRNATIEAGGGFNFDGTTASGGPGSGLTSTTQSGGGGHGGYGGRQVGSSGFATDTIASPGSGGGSGGNGSGTSSAPLGGKGGGAVRLIVANTLRTDGQISAAGLDGDINSGGGAGGGLWLSAATLTGAGSISANGGRGNGSGGGGGGGRIAINYTSNLFTGSISAAGGTGFESGGAGTIYTKNNTQTNAQLALDNHGLCCALTPVAPAFGFAENISIANGAVCQLSGSTIPVFSNLTVLAGGTLTSTGTNLDLAIAGNMQIASGAFAQFDGKGYQFGGGPGRGSTLSGTGGGGGYGGAGGASSSGAAGGTTYGSTSQPFDLGSSGGGVFLGPISGSEGGGAVRLTVSGQLSVDGLLSANGHDGVQDNSGGGSGGSLWIIANTLSGAGSITANGGSGEPYQGGGGGGGRIAIYSPNNTFAGPVSVTGGAGAVSGNAGTIFTSASLPGLSVISQSPSGIVSNTVTFVTLGFSSPIDPSSFPGTSVALSTPVGYLSPGSILLNQAGPATLNISFPIQNLPGDYRLEFGPGIQDLFGQTLSQVYTGAFTLALPLIIGSVHDTNGVPIPGVVLQQTTSPLLSTTTDANGQYSLGVDSGWTGSIVPSLTNALFAPGSRAYAGIAITATNQDYQLISDLTPVMTASHQGSNFGLNWYGITGVTYQPQYSTNLFDWLPYNGPIGGTNGPVLLQIPINLTDTNKFFRIQANN